MAEKKICEGDSVYRIGRPEEIAKVACVLPEGGLRLIMTERPEDNYDLYPYGFRFAPTVFDDAASRWAVINEGRYFLFMGDEYYPHGGWGDFSGAYTSIEEAQEAGPTEADGWLSGDCAQIVDRETLRVVAWFHNGLYSRNDEPSGWRMGS